MLLSLLGSPSKAMSLAKISANFRGLTDDFQRLCTPCSLDFFNKLPQSLEFSQDYRSADSFNIWL